MAVLTLVISGVILILCMMALAERRRNTRDRMAAGAHGGDTGWPVGVMGDGASDCSGANAGGCDGGGGD